MALGKAEFRRRVIAALALHGKELKDLPDLLADYELPKHSVARMGREGDPSTPTRGVILALSDALELPVEWFEADDWRPLLRTSAQAEAESPATRLDLAALRAELLEDLARELEARDVRQRQPEPGDSAEGLTGG